MVFLLSVTELVSNLASNCTILMQNVTVQGNHNFHCYNAILHAHNNYQAHTRCGMPRMKKAPASN